MTLKFHGFSGYTRGKACLVSQATPTLKEGLVTSINVLTFKHFLTYQIPRSQAERTKKKMRMNIPLLVVVFAGALLGGCAGGGSLLPNTAQSFAHHLDVVGGGPVHRDDVVGGGPVHRDDVVGGGPVHRDDVVGGGPVHRDDVVGGGPVHR